MYESYFGLIERPFSIAPDPQYLYMSSRHKEAMAHLTYGLSQGGCFIVLTGEVGTGKTTLCRNLLGELPDNVDVALILNANISEQELLQTICDELKIEYTLESSPKQLLDLLNKYLLNTYAQNRHTVLIIDEAQLLSRNVLEQIRLLTNLETTKSKLLQIILIGQPELNDLLSRNDLRQLAQRVTARYHLGALQRSEIEDYVNYRLSVAGCKQPLFSKQALTKMHALTEGIPRRINILADHALLSAYARTQTLVDSKTVKLAANDVFVHSKPNGRFSQIRKELAKWWLPACAVILLNVALWWYFSNSSTPTTATDAVELASTNKPDNNLQTSADSAAVDSALASSDVSSSLTETSQSEPVVVGTVVIAEQFLDDSIASAPGKEASSIITDPALTAPQSGSTASARVIDVPVANGEPSVSLQQAADQSTQSALERLLETSADVTGMIRTFKALVNIWQQSLPDQLIHPGCQAVTQLGLRCLVFSEWTKMERYNRPAIIIISHLDQLHRVIIQSIAGAQAQIMVGDSTLQVDLAELKTRWVREGVLVWRPSELGTGFLRVGDQGDTVVAARDYLNRALAQARLPLLKSIDLDEFDLDMSQKVFALQTRFGIGGDGVIGNETYLLMNELVDLAATPVLTTRVR